MDARRSCIQQSLPSSLPADGVPAAAIVHLQHDLLQVTDDDFAYNGGSHHKTIELGQIIDKDMKSALDSIQAITEAMITTFIGSNIFSSIFLGGMLSYLWGLVNTLQIIVLTALFSVGQP